ncbi:MAG: class I SAM-dependent methyltransferase [Planctomycetota bacterium]|nr:class I SAM-dependent methyltransferase [Planctomycetota bacterium]
MPKKTPRRTAKASMATRADRHELYQRAVQTVDAEIDFVDDTFKILRGRFPRLLREDFCGTANTSCEFVRRRPGNRAFGVDLDESTLEWGIVHNLGKLKGAARSRVELIRDNVLTVRTPPVDAVLAMNFSYYLFHERATLRRYFSCVRDALTKDGLFFLDAYGGSDAFRVMTEKRPIGRGVTYIWDQAAYDPVSGMQTCRIHFQFKDGSKLRNAFEYEWRLWTLPEIREVLGEAGFARSTVYWEGWNEKTWEGDGDFRPVERGEPDLGWIVYIVAEP